VILPSSIFYLSFFISYFHSSLNRIQPKTSTRSEVQFRNVCPIFGVSSLKIRGPKPT